MMKQNIIKTLLVVVAMHIGVVASAQHTLGVSGGVGAFTSRLYPEQMTRTTFGAPNFGLSWRYYSLPRYVGAVGVDLEYMQRGFSYGYAYSVSADEKGEEMRQYYYYTRRLNSIMLPIVWQPHVYLAKRHVRLYVEPPLRSRITSAATMSMMIRARVAVTIGVPSAITASTMVLQVAEALLCSLVAMR